MKIAILGAGFTGLSAALNLLKAGHQVEVFEKHSDVGGLAAGFSQDDWDWTLEKAYHHWFTNDNDALNLAKQLNYPIIIKKPQTNILVNGKILPFDSPQALLNFTPLSLIDRLRTAMGVGFLKLFIFPKILEGHKAIPWIKTVMGQKSYQIIWEPVLKSKFGDFLSDISLSWFWARIYKRTPNLVYPHGGFKQFGSKLLKTVEQKGGKFYFGTEIKQVEQQDERFIIKTSQGEFHADKIISTLPTPILIRIFPNLPPDYVKRISSIPHLHAQNLILVLKKSFLTDGSYWVSIADTSFPFLVLAEHTNFMESKHYNNQHILYIGNYLPQDHPYLKMNTRQLLQIFDPYLKKINPTYRSSLISYHLFVSPFAQPVVSSDYLKKIPKFKSPIKNLYIANMDMVYPWDRGTNYALQMGRKVAEVIDKD